MRVIAGEARGRKLHAPPGSRVRPILDRVKVALFSLLEARGFLAGARVLDLYAGAGSLGIEALSRGAASAVFVESDPRVVAFLQKNLEATGLAPGADTRRATVAEVLDSLIEDDARFELIFFDPPFAESARAELGEVAEEMTRACGLLAPEGLVLLRCERKIDVPERVGELTLVERRRWGRNAVAFYAAAEQEAE